MFKTGSSPVVYRCLLLNVTEMIGVFAVIVLSSLVSAKTNGIPGKKCFSPVICSSGDSDQTTQYDWQQVYPPLACEWKSMETSKNGGSNSIQIVTNTSFTISKLNKQIESLNTTHEEEMREIREEFVVQINYTNTKLTTFSRLLNESMEENKRLQEEIESLNTTHEEEMREIKEEFVVQINGTNTNLTTFSRSLNESMEENKRLQEGTNTKLTTFSRSLNESMEENKRLQEEMKTLRESHERLLVRSFQKIGLCNVSYEGKCFWAVDHGITNVDFQEAESICAKSGGVPANIYNREQEDEIMQYVRGIFKTNHVWMWLGMTVNPLSGTLFHRDGTKASHKHWYDGVIPNSAPGKTNIIHTIVRDERAKRNGIQNVEPTFNAHGVICEAILTS